MSDADRTGARRQSQSGNPSGNPIGNPCQACGACCGYSSNWPRFTIEDDAALDLIPAELVNARLSGMRCDGDRCAALRGEIGVETACTIYAIRPDVCRTCMPGDAECAMARRKYGLPTLTLTVVPAESRDSAA
jgi:uncharacterized protein